MKSQFRAVNRFISKIKSTSSIDGISNSGTFQVEDTTVAGFSLPQGAVTFYVTADFAQTGKEEIFRIVNVAGDVLTYDKRIPVGGYVKPAHAAGASIRINDVADIINEMSENIDNFGKVSPIAGTQTVKVWGGIFNNNGTIYNVATATLAVAGGELVDNSTNYIHFVLSTQLFTVTASSTFSGAVCMASVVVSGGVIGTIADLRPGFATTYGEIPTKLDIAGGLRTTMGVSRGTLEIDDTGNEVKRSITDGASISNVDTIRKRKADGTYEEIPYSVLQGEMTLKGGGAFSISPYEASIALGNPVGMTSEGLIKCTTENKSSANISASSINILGQASLDSTRTFFLYAVGLVVYARVGTLSGDVMTYGTEVTLGTLGTGSVTGGCAYLDTDKVICTYWDSATSGAVARHRICTVSGTTITQGTEVTQGMTAISPKSFVGLCKVRANAYAWGNWDTNTYYFYIFTVSGTTITPNGTSFLANTTGQFPPNFAYLSDNVIAVGGAGNGTQMVMYLLEVNPLGTTITTTHTYNTGVTSGSGWTLCRTGNTEYVFTYNVTTVAKLAKAISGTTLVYTALVTAPSTSLPLCPVGPNHFAIVNGTSVLIYSRGGELIGTILGISSPASNTLFQFMNMVLGRWVYINGTNGTSRIINFAKVFYFGIANNTTGGVIKRGTITISGIVMNVKYYLQSDGTISDTFSDRYAGIGIATNTLLIG